MYFEKQYKKVEKINNDDDAMNKCIIQSNKKSTYECLKIILMVFHYLSHCRSWHIEQYYEKKMLSYLPVCFEKQYKKSNYFMKKTHKFNVDRDAKGKCIIQPKENSTDKCSQLF